jgi:hypothetical protein
MRECVVIVKAAMKKKRWVQEDMQRILSWRIGPFLQGRRWLKGRRLLEVVTVLGLNASELIQAMVRDQLAEYRAKRTPEQIAKHAAIVARREQFERSDWHGQLKMFGS